VDELNLLLFPPFSFLSKGEVDFLLKMSIPLLLFSQKHLIKLVHVEFFTFPEFNAENIVYLLNPVSFPLLPQVEDSAFKLKLKLSSDFKVLDFQSPLNLNISSSSFFFKASNLVFKGFYSLSLDCKV
jgi:hypothetical protein